MAKQIKVLRQGLGMEKDDILIPFSAETKQGRDEIWELIEGMCASGLPEEREETL